jgi:hypothetical protein
MADEAENTFERVQKLLEQTILREYPNPERRGCPGSDALKRIAAQDRPPTSDPAWQHTIRCAPCYTEFLEYRRQYKAARQGARIHRRYALGGLAAAVLICLALIFVWRPSSGVFRPTFRDVSEIRNFRGETQSVQPSLTLPLENLDLTLRLPVGSREGTYEVLVEPMPGAGPVASGTGDAHIVNGSTMLRLRIKLRTLKPGIYYLDFRRDGRYWMLLTCRLSIGR